jgi:hypothetical protein
LQGSENGRVVTIEDQHDQIVMLNQLLSSLILSVAYHAEIRKSFRVVKQLVGFWFGFMVLNATFNNISIIS